MVTFAMLMLVSTRNFQPPREVSFRLHSAAATTARRIVGGQPVVNVA